MDSWKEVGFEQRWTEEATYFDAEASALRGGAATDPAVFARYARPVLRQRFHKEYRLHLLGDVSSKTILDVGCGLGENAAILAKRGAHVTGVDVSQESVMVARERAARDGVASGTRFLCSPIETADLKDRSFDIIWGDGILHHLLPVLDTTVRRLVHLAKPGATLIFFEPVCFHAALRRLRLLIPVAIDGTPGERPLEPRDIDIVRRHVPDLMLYPYAFLGRLCRFFLEDNYERASFLRRSLADSLLAMDQAILSVDGLQRLGGCAIMIGHAPE